MDRRTFLKATGAASLLAPTLIRDALAAQTQPLVAVAEGTDYPAITRTVINALGGMKRFVKAGDVVVVKPNMGWDRSTELAANTHPQVVRAVVEECLAAGARKVKVFDSTCNDARRCYVNSGIESALKGSGTSSASTSRRNASARSPSTASFSRSGSCTTRHSRPTSISMSRLPSTTVCPG